MRSSPSRTPAATWVSFTVADVHYAIAAGWVRGLAAGVERGALAARGFPRHDLRRLFGLPPAPAGERLLLVHDGAGRSAALAVDTILGLAQFAEDTLVPLPGVYRGRARRWFPAIARFGDRLTVIVAVPALLDDLAVVPLPLAAKGGA